MKRAFFHIAPVCLVGLLASSCSKHDQQGTEAAGAHPIPPHSEPRSRMAPAKPEERYAAVRASRGNPVASRETLGDFYRKWGSENGRDAVRHAMAKHPELARFAFEGWIEAVPAAPREWVLSERDGSRWQAALATGLLRAIPVNDSEARREWGAHFAGGSNGAPIISEIALGWAKEAPEEALDWLAELPDGASRTGAIEATMQRWLAEDPEAASSHLARMKTGRARDEAIGALVKGIAGEDPEAAELWIAEISETQRLESAAAKARLPAARNDMWPSSLSPRR